MKTRLTLYTLAAAFALGIGTTASAQEDAAQLSYTPKDMWEFGIHGGYGFLEGDYDRKLGYGGGLHLRRALDHIFSLRLDGQYLRTDSEAPLNRAPYVYSEVRSTLAGGSLQGVVTLNNFRFDKPNRKVNFYIFGGPGVSYLNIKGDLITSGDERDIIEDRDFDNLGFNAVTGGGIAFRVGPRFNIGLEHKIMVPFGKTADWFDGYNNSQTAGTTYRDILNYSNLRLNFNIGNSAERTEPLYWVNPLNQVIDELTELKARPQLDLTDTDGDGIIDMLDQEVDTPEGAAVDTRGVALDSDGDGVPDYEDAEPYSPPGMTVDARGVAQVPKYMTEPEVEDLIARRMRDFDNSQAAGAMEDWFLPMIHFELNGYTIRQADYGHMKNIATVMRANPSLRVVVEGFTDKLASDEYNRVLSYNRARSAKEYLVNRYGISPDRLIIQYEGEDDVLVPTQSGSFMNRRVEFKVAQAGDVDMGQPEGPRAGRGTFFSGARDAGY